jgi:hypothetical protein
MEQALRKYSCRNPELLSDFGRVIRIKNARNRFGRKSLRNGAYEIAMAELVEVETVSRTGVPKPKRVDGAAAVAHHRPVEGNAEKRQGFAGNRGEQPGSNLKRATQLHLDDMIEPDDFPGIGTAQPVVRLFVLPSVADGLLKDSVFIAKAIAHGRQIHGGHRFDEASRQAAEAAIAQTGIGFLIQQLIPVDILFAACFLHRRIEQQVGDVARQRTANEEFHREIIGPLRTEFVLVLFGA